MPDLASRIFAGRENWGHGLRNPLPFNDQGRSTCKRGFLPAAAEMDPLHVCDGPTSPQRTIVLWYGR